ncbi:MAG: histidine kinase [Gemmatimonadota bacterium]|jgi:signal transduction histidine kinase
MAENEGRIDIRGAHSATSSGRAARIALVTALPLVLGAALVVQAATVGTPGAGGEPTPVRYLPGMFFPWLLYGLMAPAVYLFVERIPLGRDTLARSLTVHGVGALAFALVHVALATTLHLLVYRPGDLAWTTFYGNNLGSLLFTSLTQYVLLAGASHALVFHARLRERELTTLRLESHLAEARIEALTGQLGPHFLFNALNTVSALARRGRTEALREVVDDLADLLRLTLAGDTPVVPVARELEWLERYLGIQTARFGDRLSVDLDVPSRLTDASVPRLVLQPLIENAVKHGLSRRRGALRVSVRFSEAAGELLLVVSDDGPGFPTSPGEIEPGVGLRNLQARLDELYGGAAVLSLGASAAGGARVEIRVPLERHAATPAAGPRSSRPAAV